MTCHLLLAGLRQPGSQFKGVVVDNVNPEAVDLRGSIQSPRGDLETSVMMIDTVMHFR